MSNRSISHDDDWIDLRRQWKIRDGTTYLNHGSFGPPPEPVRSARRYWIDQLDQQPMDFFLNTSTTALLAARETLAGFVGTSPHNIVFVENATAAMNNLADSFPLQPGDEVVLNDHEYDAVTRIWQRRCRRAGAAAPKVAKLSIPVVSREALVESVLSEVTDRTRLIVVSHITSPTAIVMPVEQLCREARRRGIPICIDGPHAPAQLDLNIDQLQCDFYTASCHKWLCAPFGSGFLFVSPQHHHYVEPQQLSWGTLPPDEPENWDDEFLWSGTRDPSTYLGIPAAIEFMETVGLDLFRQRTHHLAEYAREQLLQLQGTSPITDDDPNWYGSMSLVKLTDGDARDLQLRLWKSYGITIPIVEFLGGRYARVSCHLYNRCDDIRMLRDALHKEL